MPCRCLERGLLFSKVLRKVLLVTLVALLWACLLFPGFAVAEHELAVCVISSVCFICRVGAIDLDVAFALDFAADYFGGKFVYESFIIIKNLLYLETANYVSLKFISMKK